MNDFKPEAQAGQDRFALAICDKPDGTFVDIGCAHPIVLNNTIALERIGWIGVLLEGNPVYVDECRALRRSPLFQADARTFDWGPPLSGFADPIDFASIDVDENSFEAFRTLLATSRRRFRVVTIEHDFYSRGDRIRIPIRALAKENGYELIAADVVDHDLMFEDWFVIPELVDMTVANKFVSTGLDWRKVLALGQ